MERARVAAAGTEGRGGDGGRAAPAPSDGHEERDGRRERLRGSTGKLEAPGWEKRHWDGWGKLRHGNRKHVVIDRESDTVANM